MTNCNHWSHAGEWQKLRRDVNILAWLLAEEKYINANQPRFKTIPGVGAEEEVEEWHGKANASVEGSAP